MSNKEATQHKEKNDASKGVEKAPDNLFEFEKVRRCQSFDM
jgi:hypothetical protein